MKKLVYILNKKIVVFKNSQYANIGDYTDNKKNFSFFPLRLFYNETREIINDDRENKDQDIYRYQRHVKNTTGDQKMHPSEPVRQQEINDGNNRKENKKLNRIKKHVRWLVCRFLYLLSNVCKYMP